MSSELHIPSIIRPHFDPPSDLEDVDDGPYKGADTFIGDSVKQEHTVTHFPKVNKKENAHVTFAASLPKPVFEKSKTTIPAVTDTKLNVDHKHYEQWARNPNRKAPSTALFRGIQQLKAKKIREKESVEEMVPAPEPYRISSFATMLRDNTTLSRTSAGSASGQQLQQPGKQKPNVPSSIEASFNRSYSSIRNILKPTQCTFDGVGLKRQSKKESLEGMSEEMQRLNRKIDIASSQDILESARDLSSTGPAKHRIGLSKIHDRNPFPVSINQPVCIGDHVFLVNEPVYFKTAENWRLKSRGSDNISISSAKFADKMFTSGGPLSAPGSQHLKPSFPLDGQGDIDQEEELLRGSLHKAGSYFGSFLPKKSNRRIPAVISSAELYDFSQLAELRSSHEMKYLERNKSEASIYLRGPKLTKLVPRAQRLSALLQ